MEFASGIQMETLGVECNFFLRPEGGGYVTFFYPNEGGRVVSITKCELQFLYPRM